MDNGKNWKIVYQNSYPDGFLDSIEFWDKKNGIAIGDPINGKFDILLTIDGGNSWNKQTNNNTNCFAARTIANQPKSSMDRYLARINRHYSSFPVIRYIPVR